MNEIVENQYPLFRYYQALRSQLMESLTDDVLSFSPGGANPALGALCLEIGETQQSYIDSFRSFELDFSYRYPQPEIAGSVDALKAWYATLDQELYAVIHGLSAEDIAGRVVERGPNFKVPPGIQLEIYKEALLIFYGKVSVYLKAIGKERTEQWQEWIA